MIQFHFHPHFALETLAENKVHLFNRKTQARLATSSPQLISLFSSLSQGETEENLYKNWLEDQGDAIYFYYALDQTIEKGVVKTRQVDAWPAQSIVPPDRDTISLYQFEKTL